MVRAGSEGAVLMGSIRVVSKRAGGVAALPGETVVSCDRSSPLLGNRHVLRDHRDKLARETVIRTHLVEDLEPDVLSGGPIYRQLEQFARRMNEGERIALACWCAPLPCHCDAYAEAVSLISQGYDLAAVYRSRVEARSSPPAIDQYDFGF